MHRAAITAVAAALMPHAARLSTSPEVAASALLALTFGAAHPMTGGEPADPDTIVHLILHGIAKEA